MEQHHRGGKGIPNPPATDIHKVAASAECTGLIPSAVESEDEAENYQHLYAIHKQKVTDVQSRDQFKNGKLNGKQN